MSGNASVPNTFSNAVTATGAQLDANYSTVVAYLNNPTNRNNFGQGGAVTNTVAITFTPPVVGGYTAGLELTWKWGTVNSGAVVLNANGVGNISLVNPDGSALQAGQGVAGSIGKAVSDGTQAIYLTPPSPATKAAMQTATASASFVSPAQMQNHPGVAKATAAWSGTATGTVTAISSYNVTSIVRVGTGTYSIALTTAFASTAYVVVSTPGNSVQVSTPASKAAGGFQILSFNSTNGAAADAAEMNFAAFGPQ